VRKREREREKERGEKERERERRERERERERREDQKMSRAEKREEKMNAMRSFAFFPVGKTNQTQYKNDETDKLMP
jgi:hypothetical protein